MLFYSKTWKNNEEKLCLYYIIIVVAVPIEVQCWNLIESGRINSIWIDLKFETSGSNLTMRTACLGQTWVMNIYSIQNTVACRKQCSTVTYFCINIIIHSISLHKYDGLNESAITDTQ